MFIRGKLVAGVRGEREFSMKRNELYRCSKCGVQLEVLVSGSDDVELVCCGEVLKAQRANSSDGAGEKHLPVAESCPGGILVRVGDVPHPMSEEHHIEWIEVINGAYVNRFYLKPGELPQAVFSVPLSPELIIRESCNIHGVWQKKPRD